jgi:hypothetical protein
MALLTNLYYRFLKFPAEFKNTKGIAAIGNVYHNSLVIKSVRRGERVRKDVLKVIEQQKVNDKEIDKLEKSSMASIDKFYTLQRNIRWQTLLFFVLLLSEIGLNIFTARIIIPAYDLRGLLWDLIRFAIAIAVTVTATWACDKFLESILTHRRNEDAGQNKIARIVIYVVIFVFAEVVIGYFGLVRAHDVEGNDENVTVAMTILAMIVPVVAGAIWWNINEKYDEYVNRNNYERRLLYRAHLASRLKALREQELTKFKELSNGYWYTFLSVRTYKENFNRRRQIDEEVKEPHLNSFDAFNQKAFERYNQTLTA